MRETRANDRATAETERLQQDTENIRRDAEQVAQDDSRSSTNDDRRYRTSDESRRFSSRGNEQWPVMNLASSFMQFTADLAAFGLQQMGVVASAMMGMNSKHDSRNDHSRNDDHDGRYGYRNRREPASTRL